MTAVPDVAGRDLSPPRGSREDRDNGRDEVVPGDRWAFDQAVADSFDDMLERSIPQHDVMRAEVSRLAARHLSPGASLLDLGCSRGAALAGVLAELGDLAAFRASPSRFVGMEVSEPMRSAARARFAGEPLVEVVDHDLRDPLPGGFDGSCGVVLAVLTVQFTPIEHRLRLLADCRRALRPGGALILVEKVLGASAAIDQALVDLYYRRKREAGYSPEQIDRKRLSLEGVLVPLTARWNEELLASAGFREVDGFWRSLNFAGWVALA